MGHRGCLARIETEGKFRARSFRNCCQPNSCSRSGMLDWQGDPTAPQTCSERSRSCSASTTSRCQRRTISRPRRKFPGYLSNELMPCRHPSFIDKPESRNEPTRNPRLDSIRNDQARGNSVVLERVTFLSCPTAGSPALISVPCDFQAGQDTDDECMSVCLSRARQFLDRSCRPFG